jgi:hypothetical protein
VLHKRMMAKLTYVTAGLVGLLLLATGGCGGFTLGSPQCTILPAEVSLALSLTLQEARNRGVAEADVRVTIVEFCTTFPDTLEPQIGPLTDADRAELTAECNTCVDALITNAYAVESDVPPPTTRTR